MCASREFGLHRSRTIEVVNDGRDLQLNSSQLAWHLAASDQHYCVRERAVQTPSITHVEYVAASLSPPPAAVALEHCWLQECPATASRRFQILGEGDPPLSILVTNQPARGDPVRCPVTRGRRTERQLQLHQACLSTIIRALDRQLGAVPR